MNERSEQFSHVEEEASTLTDQDITEMVEGLDFFGRKQKAVEALSNLVSELWDDLPSYDTIISDEASGRIPALVFKKLIDKRRNENDYDPVRFRAIAGGRVVDRIKREVSNYLDDLIEKEEGLGKTLLVTEYVEEGKGVGWLAEQMEEKGVDFEIAAVSVAQDLEHYPRVVANRLTQGSQGDMAGLGFYGKYDTSGVKKDFKVDDPFPQKKEGADQEDINRMRAEIDKLSERLYEKLSGFSQG